MGNYYTVTPTGVKYLIKELGKSYLRLLRRPPLKLNLNLFNVIRSPYRRCPRHLHQEESCHPAQDCRGGGSQARRRHRGRMSNAKVLSFYSEYHVKHMSNPAKEWAELDVRLGPANDSRMTTLIYLI